MLPELTIYRLVNPSSVQSLHGTLSSTGVIVLDKAVVVALGLQASYVSRASQKLYYHHHGKYTRSCPE